MEKCQAGLSLVFAEAKIWHSMFHFVKPMRPYRSIAKARAQNPEHGPGTYGGENSMNARKESVTVSITSRLKDIKTEFAKLRPAEVTRNGNRSMTVK